VRILAGDTIEVAARPPVTVYVFRVQGPLRREAKPPTAPPMTRPGAQETCSCLPAVPAPQLERSRESVLYWVHDAPCSSFLGGHPEEPRFEPPTTRAPGLRQELASLAADPSSARSNRLKPADGQRGSAPRRTVTHTLWAMLGLVPAARSSRPTPPIGGPRLVIDCQPGLRQRSCRP